MATTYWVTQTSLSLPNLYLSTAPYSVVDDGKGIEPGKVVWRRSMVTSPFIDGAWETHSVRDITELDLIVHIQDTSPAAVQNDIAALVQAFGQTSYQLYIDNGGTEYAWNCNRADYSIPFSLQFLLGNAEIQFKIPRQPTAVSGPF